MQTGNLEFEALCKPDLSDKPGTTSCCLIFPTFKLLPDGTAWFKKNNNIDKVSLNVLCHEFLCVKVIHVTKPTLYYLVYMHLAYHGIKGEN